MSEDVSQGWPARWMPRGPLWRHRDFMRLWAAQILSAFGARITRTALPIIAILTIDASPTEVAILGTLSFAPGFLVGLFGGGVVDRARKRPLLIGADLVRAGLICIVPLAAWSGALSMPLLYLVAAGVGAGNALFNLVHHAYVPGLVGRDTIVDANAKLEATDSIAEAAGPGIGGILIQLITAPLAMLVDAATYIWSALMLARIRGAEPPPAPAAPRAHLLSDVAEGFGAIWRDPRMRAAFLYDHSAAFFGGFYMALYMIIMLRVAGLSPGVAGVLISLGGIGAFAGALLAGPAQRAFGAGPVIATAMLAGNAVNLFIPLAAALPLYAIAFFALQQLLGDALLQVGGIHKVSMRQRIMPGDMLGRAGAADQVMSGAAMPIGALIAGPLSERIGIAPTAWIAAIGGTLAALFLFTPALLKER